MPALPIYEPVVRQICGVDFVFPEYKEPLVQLKGAVKGYMRGTLPNALADGRLPCAFCDPSKTHRGHKNGADNLFDRLGRHVYLTHAMTAVEYRDAVGLMRKTTLSSRREVMRHRAHNTSRHPALWAFPRRQTPKGTTFEGRRSRVSPESLNKEGHCRAQVIAVAKKAAKGNGGVLRFSDLERQGIHERTIKRVGFANTTALAVEVGATALRPDRTDAELLRAFRELADRLGQTPTVSNLGRANGMPAPASYVKRFGSMTETARRCGLPPNLPRPIAEGDEIDILNQYAIASPGRWWETTLHRSWYTVNAVLAKYGVVPSPIEAERAKARAWAAEIAQRLAGTEEMTA